MCNEGRSGGRVVRRFPLLWLLLFAAACPVFAQQVVGGIPSSQQVDRNGDRLPTEEQREFNRKILRGEQPTPERPHDPRLAEAQIRDDFRSLQLLNNRVQAGAARGGAEYQGLTKPLGEIRKRARRLKANLALAEAKGEAGAPEPAGEASLEALLSRLDESVKGFVRNPMFGNVKVFDVEQSKKARADLERVIDLSGKIAERLRREAR